MFLESRIPALLGALGSLLLGCGLMAAQAAAAGPWSGTPLSPPAVLQSTPPARAGARAGTGSITGRVVSSPDDLPLGRARIIISSPTLPEARVAISGADGTFAFDRLPAGSYSLAASRSGYAPQSHMEARPPSIVLADGQSVKGIDVALLPAGVIAGRILDEDQKPFAGAIVDALVPRTLDGQATLVAVATTESDDRGEFRLSGLAAGQYYVSAFDPAFANVGDESGPLRYAATYYPGVASVEQAARVAVTPGAEPAAGISITLKLVRPAHVSGRITPPDRRQLVSAAMIMTHAGGASAIPAEDATILPDGTFTFRNISPGRYEIRARGEVAPGKMACFARFRVFVDGNDITNIQMPLLAAATVSGTVRFEAVRTPKPAGMAGLHVRAPLADGTSFGSGLPADVNPNGTYAIRAVMAGSHLLSVQGLTSPWILKSVTFAGQDITDTGLEANAGQRFENVRITLTDAATELSGLVRDAKSQAVPDAMVLVIPLAPQFWHPGSRRFAVLRTDGDGRFRIRGLPEGEYRAVASLDVDESDAYRPAVLEPLSEAGVALSLKPLEQRVLDLPLTRASALRRASAR
jgi:hypothetical protein